VIVGVSTDSVKKHQNFKKKYQLPYTLVADTDHRIAEQYGVWAEKLFFGRKYWGIVRTTFIIDARGRVARILTKLEPEQHATEAAAAVAALQK
jgi:thioredoxin-dependent peroxiredoxin